MASRTLAQWLQRIEALHPSEIELGLERAARVYSRLSSGTEPPVITVAGTNGKGSTVECLTRCALASGLSVGTYTSPHLVRFNERMCLNGEYASDAQIVAAFERVEAARDNVALTYFEFTTLAALALFREAQLDLWVLEVGLGGRLDAVNIIDAHVCVITAIGLDHQDWLGNDRDVIGREKAGIMRAGAAAICSDPNPPHTVAEHAHALGASLCQLGQDYTFDCDDEVWEFRLKSTSHSISLSNLPRPRGAVLDNMAGALAALAVADLLPDEQQLKDVFSNWSLRGRLQRIELEVPWWLDVAHNTESAELLANTLLEANEREHREECFVVIGMLGDKPVDDVVEAMARVATQWLVVGLDSPRALNPAELVKKVQQASTARVEVLQSVAAGLAVAKARANVHDCIVVTGSFHTVGPALAWLNR